MAIFHYQSIEGYGSRTEGLVFAWEHQRAATLGSMNWCCDWFQDYTARFGRVAVLSETRRGASCLCLTRKRGIGSTKLSQHISQIAIGLFQLAVSICAATGTLVLEVILHVSHDSIISLDVVVKIRLHWSNARDNILSCSQHQMKQLGWKSSSYLCNNNCLRLEFNESYHSLFKALRNVSSLKQSENPWCGNALSPHIRAAPSDRGEWKKHSLMSNWNIGDPHCGGDLVEVTDMSMRVFFVMTEELFTDFTVALEAQAATMANADNPNRNTRPSANSYLRICRLLPKHVPNAEKLVDGLLQGLPGSIEEMFTASKPHKLRG
ncbi:hypothetical protein Tco_0530495 [Tanacetum coccineum]